MGPKFRKPKLASAKTESNKGSFWSSVTASVVGSIIFAALGTVAVLSIEGVKNYVKDYFGVSNLETQIDELQTTVGKSTPKLTTLETTVTSNKSKILELEKNQLNYLIKEISINNRIGKYQKISIPISWGNSLKNRVGEYAKRNQKLYL